MRPLRLAFLAGILAVVALVIPALGTAHNVENFGQGQPVHWSDRSQLKASMWLIDYTGSNWPVYDSAVEWNNNGRVVITYQYGTASGCPNDCVGVDTSNTQGPCSGQNITYGQTNPAFTNNGGHLTGATNVRFNVHCAGNQLNDAGRRELTCHELGHAVGWIGHRSGSCMRTGYIVGPLQRFPSGHDFDMFDSPLYDHND